jgi:exodeoxyribonuclease V alpha subunit
MVDNIVSERPFGVIFGGTTTEAGAGLRRGAPLRVRATFDKLLGVPAVGDTWEISGTAAGTPYGLQVIATSGRRILPSGRMIARFVAEHVPGIGERRARLLWEAFGENLAEILADEGAIDEIATTLAPDRPVLARRLAAMAVSTWRQAAGEAALVDWLSRQGIDDLKIARRLHRVLGDAAAERLASNPYVVVPLLSWTRLDAIGRRLLREDGFDPTTDARRITGAADEVVKRMLRRGDTAAAPSSFVEEMLALLPGGPGREVCLDIALRNGAVVGSADLLRAPGAAWLEDDLVRRLKQLAAAPQESPQEALTASGWSDLISQAESPLRPLSADQRASVAAILTRQLSCLAGGAGTGKTHTCRVLCDLWARSGGDVVLCALAGKAALRLSRSTKRLAKTLARTLAELAEREEIEEEFDGADLDDPAAEKKRLRLQDLCRLTSRTLLVIDESSMVDLPTVHSMMKRVPQGGKVLFVGDEAQLPPVGFGLVYHTLVKDASITARLNEVHRRAAETGIPAASQQVREGVLPVLPEYRGKTDGIFLLEVPTSEVAASVDRLCDEFGREGLVVTSTIGGAAGVRSVNERRHAMLEAAAAKTTKGFFGLRFAVGEPVIFGRNDYRAGLFNGLFGEVQAVDPEERTLDVLFDGDVEPKTLGGEHLLDLDHAYAVTCHKCQGSSAPRVIVPIYPSRLLDRSWIYTAITRGERQVVLVGDTLVLAEALARPPAAELRRSGMQWRS